VRFESDLSNSFVMKYLFDKDTNHQCLYEASLTRYEIQLLSSPSTITRIDADYRTTTSMIIQ
jgi:hypothetical protein